jgi:hypothetical protein
MYADTFELEKWLPKTREEVLFPMIVEVGFKGRDGISRYYVDVATPEALRSKVGGPILSERSLILVADYEYSALEASISKIIEAAARETELDVCRVLSRYFTWEYEDFVSPVSESEGELSRP